MRTGAYDSQWHDFRTQLLRGPVSGARAIEALGVSRPTFSRMVKAWRDRLVVAGRARATSYMGAREILDVGNETPVFEIQDDGSSRHIGTLHGVLARGFFFDGSPSDRASQYFEDLPYFLGDLRPAGFLGRLVPRMHPELQYPSDITHWGADQNLSYCHRFGWNLPGNIIVGQPAFQMFLQRTGSAATYVACGARESRYPALANDVFKHGPPGSSAAGEQPKFLVARSDDGMQALVKFSPPTTTPLAERISDLLVAEHIALQTMDRHGQDAAKTEVVFAGGRTFLESQRFDRLSGHGRRGVISLQALDAQFLGDMGDWIQSAHALVQAKILPKEVLTPLRWRQRFGEMIGNVDMHNGNLAFFTQTFSPKSLTPTYDMGPALYAPRQSELPHPFPINPPLPGPHDGAIWTSVCDAAEEFWTAVKESTLLSTTFRNVADGNLVVVGGQRAMGRHLPASG